MKTCDHLGTLMRGLLMTMLLIWGLPVWAQLFAEQPEGVTADELKAIVEEARARYPLGNGMEDPKGPPWKTLNREKLARIMASSQIREIERTGSQSRLFDQALAWDLVHFQNLNDIRRLFMHLRGPDYFTQGWANKGYIGHYAVSTASDEGGALSILFDCLPISIWVPDTEDPLVWSIQVEDSDVIFYLRKFGQCVRGQSEQWGAPGSDSAPPTTRGARSAPIIEDRISRQLLTQGCKGAGPDSCLLLLRLLSSLSPAHPDMAAILRLMEQQMQAMQSASVSEDLQKLSSGKEPDAKARYDQARKQIWRQGIVLQAKLDNILLQPKAWPDGALQATVDASLALMREWRELGNQFGGAWAPWGTPYGLENPWLPLARWDISPAEGARLQVLGRAFAAAAGCDLAEVQSPDSWQPPQFWYAYALAKLQNESQSCRVLPVAWINEQYRQASQKRQPQLLTPIAELEKYARSPGEVRGGLRGACPEQNYGADYWGVCAYYAGVARAQREADEAERLKKERAEKLITDDLCANGNLSALLDELGYASEANGFAKTRAHTACKSLPDAPQMAALAIFHLRELPNSPNNPDSHQGDYDLHLLLASKDGEVLAEGREENAAYSDAVSLDDVAIDTGRYRLAPQVRAFGVSTYNGAHCYQCNYGEGRLSLFVREGKKLRRVLDALPSYSVETDEGELEGCTPPFSEIKKITAIGGGNHFGFADLVVTTLISHNAGYSIEKEEDCTGTRPSERRNETWIYDGKRYRDPQSAHKPSR